MSPEELDYFRERALIERERAEQSTNAHVIEIHEKLAALYESLIEMDAAQRPKIADTPARHSLPA